VEDASVASPQGDSGGNVTPIGKRGGK